MTGDAPYGRPEGEPEPYRREIGGEADEDGMYGTPREAGLGDERTEVFDSHPGRGPEPVRTGRDTVLLRAAALCSVGAAAIHFGVAPEHFGEWWAYGAFFLVVAAFQAGWGLLAWTRRDTPLLAAAIAVNAATILLWVVTRTSGLPFGPDRFAPEAVGAADVACAVLEAAVTGLAIVALARRDLPSRALPRRVAIGATAAVGAVVLLTSGVALAAPQEHDHGDTAGGTGNGERHAMANLPDVSHASADDKAKAQRLLDETIKDTAKYRSTAAAKAAGYDVDAAVRRFENKRAQRPARRKLAGQTIPALHVRGPKGLHTDDHVADPSAPETLIYHRDAQGTFTLIGVMYVAQTGQGRANASEQSPPDVAGPYTRWHYHQMCKGPDGKVKPAGGHGDMGDDMGDMGDGDAHGHSDQPVSCPSGTKAHRSGYMMHVWDVQDSDLTYAYAMAPPRAQLEAYQKTLG